MAKKFYVLTFSGLHLEETLPIDKVVFWKGRVLEHEPTRENIDLFLQQVPWDETIYIFEGKLKSTYTPNYCGGAQSIQAIFDDKYQVIWGKKHFFLNTIN